jgi:orotate phosphoribosyltransferase
MNFPALAQLRAKICHGSNSSETVSSANLALSSFDAAELIVIADIFPLHKRQNRTCFWRAADPMTLTARHRHYQAHAKVRTADPAVDVQNVRGEAGMVIALLTVVNGSTAQAAPIASGLSLPALDPFWLWLIVVAIGFSGVLAVYEALGFLPPFMSRYINRNRADETIRVLRELGFDVERIRRRNQLARLGEPVKTDDLANRVRSGLKSLTIKGNLRVGQTVRAKDKGFIDLMGWSTDPSIAGVFARDLKAYWRSLVESDQVAYDFDFVATPKSGSPILGYEFARIMGRPLVLHNREPKFEGLPDEPRSTLDTATLPAPGSLGIVVDDSSTGGGKAIDVVNDLRRFGYNVRDCLVVFQPQTKMEQAQDAATRLAGIDVKLLAIVRT